MMEEIRPKNREMIEEIWPKMMPPTDVPVYCRVALGNATALNIGMFWTYDEDGRNLFVGIEDFGAYIFTGFIHWSYLEEKIRGLMQWDYMNLADFLNVQLGRIGEKQGKYK